LDMRVYETLQRESEAIAVPTSATKHYLVFNAMTPDDGVDGEFNNWYADEHIPMLRAVPGWRASTRFRLLSARAGTISRPPPPRYLALHEWETREAFATPEFKAATSTPWRRRVVVERVHQKE
ncbi:hypothetical protein GGX14DRAFT_314978, partial [Mycena pura]